LNERNRVLEDVNKAFRKLETVRKLMIKYQKKVKKFLTNDSLKKYKTKIELEFFTSVGHQISDENKDKLKATWGINPFVDIYKGLLRDKRNDTVYDKNGNRLASDVTWEQAFTCNDRVIRRNTYASWYSLERRHRKTLFLINKLITRRLYQEAYYYNYDSWTEYMVNEVYNISFKEYRYILDQCPKFTEYNKKFSSHQAHLITEAYDLAEYAPWDRHFEIKDTNDSISIVQAKQLVLDGLKCLGDEYVSKLNVCFKNNIINWSGKKDDTVDYCLAVKNTADENIINFKWDGSSASTITLAHELGHNIRNKFLKENNEVNNWTNRLTSELPSIVNSVIMCLYLIKKFKDSNAPKLQLYGLYYKFIDYIIYCLNHCGFICNFVNASDYYLSNEKNFTPADMEQMYIDFKKKYFGISELEYKKACKTAPYIFEKLDCYNDYFWHSTNWNGVLPYYVGGVVALSIATKIFNGDKETLKKYYKFLKSGTSTDPIKVVKDTLEIDLLKPAIYTEAKQIVTKIVNQFIKDIKI